MMKVTWDAHNSGICLEKDENWAVIVAMWLSHGNFHEDARGL